jgi:hypothetical protein
MLVHVDSPCSPMEKASKLGFVKKWRTMNMRCGLVDKRVLRGRIEDVGHCRHEVIRVEEGAHAAG